MNLFTKKVLLAFIIAGAIAPLELFSMKRKFIEINDTESSEESEEESEEEQKNNKYCTICEKELSSPYALKSHIAAKHNISKYLQCPLYRSKTCLKSGYKNEKSLREHLKGTHGVAGKKAGKYSKEAIQAPNNSDDSNDQKIGCPLHKEGRCRTDGYINKAKPLAEHLIHIHELDRKDAIKLACETTGEFHVEYDQFICKTCGAEMANQKNFKLHIKICTGIKKFVCDECGLSYCLISSLDRHQKKEQHSQLYKKTPEYPSFSNISESREVDDTIEELPLFNENNTIESTQDDFDTSIFFNQEAFGIKN